MLKTMYKNNQEVFDKVWQWFIVDGNKPGINRDICSYRCCYINSNRCCYINSKGDVRCAIGCLLPENIAREAEKMNHSITDLLRHDNFLLSRELNLIFNGISRNFLQDLQILHDQTAKNSVNFNHDFRDVLAGFADQHALIIPE